MSELQDFVYKMLRERNSGNENAALEQDVYKIKLLAREEIYNREQLVEALENLQEMAEKLDLAKEEFFAACNEIAHPSD
jgi:hypothetical protein